MNTLNINRFAAALAAAIAANAAAQGRNVTIVCKAIPVKKRSGVNG